jgi:hypothetical protein
MIEDAILWTIVVLVAAVVVIFVQITSWGFLTLSDCLAADFNPVCYSVHENSVVDRDSPMWWPHDDDDDGGGG